MIPEYINYWMKIIKTMSNQNTYKLAWGRAILEYIATKDDSKEDKLTIYIHDLSDIVLKYYWNQIFFFDLKQAPNDKAANIIDETRKMIDLYKEITNSPLPVWYDGARKVIGNTKEYISSIDRITTLLTNNPATYFPNADDDNSRKKVALPVYVLTKGKNPCIVIDNEHAKELKEYNDILARLLNYKWAMLLEDYNFVPRINEKVTSISDGEVKRKPLKEYEIALTDASSDNLPHDFYNQDAVIPTGEVSVDHVIPWSFMYSDDIWNLVLTTRSNNSSKSNTIPSEDTISKLKIRNILLIDTIENDKYKSILKQAIENNYVDKYYYQCKIAK